MTAIVFDGRGFARQLEEELKKKVSNLKKLGVNPKLVAVLVGDDTASKLYVSLKKRASRRVGIGFEVKKLKEAVEVDRLIELIGDLNQDETVDGIMVQLPLPGKIQDFKFKILESIDPKKDVDGLGENSPFMPATVKAVIKVIDAAAKTVRPPLKVEPLVVVVGSKGFVGKKLIKSLVRQGYSVDGGDLTSSRKLKAKTVSADILISATGVANLIKKDAVKQGAVVIDVGSPKGDVDPSVAIRASFITPVPGGVGPVTVVSLLENLVEAVSKLRAPRRNL